MSRYWPANRSVPEVYGLDDLFRRVGGSTRKVDVRISSASNRHLRGAVREGHFHEDPD